MRVGFKACITKPEPASGVIFKTQTQPYYFAGQVKPDPLGSGRVPMGQGFIAIPT